MDSDGKRRRPAVRLLAGVLTVSLLVAAPAAAEAQFQLGFQDPDLAGSSIADAAVRATHAGIERINVFWAAVAPNRPRRPANPADPRYNWSNVDSEVRTASQRHLQVILTFVDAPQWAQGPGHPSRYVSPGAWNPDPAAFAGFVHAAAVRYGGSFPDPSGGGANGSSLPRVRYWEAWNEPNIPGYFSAPNPLSAYRTLLASAYRVLKGVHADNVVSPGGLAPVSPSPGSIPPLQFSAELLCLTRVGSHYRATRSCSRARFDVVAVHPYSLAATPTKHAYRGGDLLVGDMGELKSLIQAADRVDHVSIPIWVTEFSWITNPPDRLVGDSDAVAARYVAYSMYEMWSGGANVVVWANPIRDSPSAGIVGGGLYTTAGRPKLTLQAFAFPFIASIRDRSGFVWGRAPVGGRAKVAIDRASGTRWRQVASTTTGSDGVFEARFPAPGNGRYRARVLGGATSLSYDSRAIPPKRTHLS